MLCYKIASNLVGLKIIIFIIFFPIEIEVSCILVSVFQLFICNQLSKKEYIREKKLGKKETKKA